MENTEQKSIKSQLDKINEYLMKFSNIPIKEKLFFVKHLSVMLRVGISISDALKTLSQQTENKYFKKVLLEMNRRIENGENFSQSLKSYPRIFNELFVSMIEAGEISGKLEEVLGQLFVQLKKEHSLISKVKSALTYPMVIIFAMIGMGIFMMIVIIPKITSAFTQMEAELPLPTKILIKMSDTLIHNGPLTAIVAVLLIVGFIKFIKSKTGKPIFDLMTIKFPIIGPIIKKINLARFARNISSLLKTDIMIVKTFQITANILGNSQYKNALNEMSKKIKKGEKINQMISKYPKLFPPVVTQMIAIGEETGDLDNILIELAEFYEEEIDQIMTDLPAIIEPLLILLLGVGVGGMAIAIIMPMYSLSSSI